jgi:hypothetical protein
MNWSMLRRSAVLFAGVCAAPLALAQEAAGQAQPWGFIAAVTLGALVIPIAIVAIVNISEYRQTRERLAAVERLVTAGHTVPRELMINEPHRLTLAEERRRDVRRGITLLGWALGLAVVLYLITPPPHGLRASAWGLLFLILSLGSFLKAWLTARELARGAPDSTRND